MIHIQLKRIPPEIKFGRSDASNGRAAVFYFLGGDQRTRKVVEHTSMPSQYREKS